jgi:DNA polymerase-3 subunit epsilon
MTPIETAIQLLEQDDTFAIHRKLKPSFRQSDTADGKIRTAVFVDVETTGLNHAVDENIEVAIVPFKYHGETGQITEWLERDAFSCLEEPSIPITPEITALTGITPSDVQGKRFDDALIQQITQSASLVISHNAKFDRPFLEKRFSIFKEKPWACSLTDIPWSAEGISSGKLEFIAYKYRFYYDAHRALNDCFAGVEILSRALPVSGELGLKVLLNNARRTEAKLKLVAKFEHNDKIKQLGGKWDADTKSWGCVIDLNEVETFKTKAAALGVTVVEANLTITAMNRFR